MKHLITILLFVFVTSMVTAQVDSTSYVTESNIEKLVDKYSGKIEATIISLAESLKQPAEEVWAILIKQQYVKASMGIIVLLITLLFGYLCIKYANNVKCWDDGEVIENKPTYSMGIVIIFAVCLVISLIVLLFGGYYNDILQGFINPEYGAIKDIVNLFN
jgi:hypothetical protein